MSQSEVWRRIASFSLAGGFPGGFPKIDNVCRGAKAHLESSNPSTSHPNRLTRPRDSHPNRLTCPRDSHRLCSWLCSRVRHHCRARQKNLLQINEVQLFQNYTKLLQPHQSYKSSNSTKTSLALRATLWRAWKAHSQKHYTDVRTTTRRKKRNLLLEGWSMKLIKSGEMRYSWLD